MRTPIAPDERTDRTVADNAITVVIPCFNEQDVLKATYARLSACTRSNDVLSWTFLFVDDGSSDRTWPLLGELRLADPRVRLIRLSRNFGHQAALAAGIDHAVADAVVVLDADLQDPPEMIGEFVARWRNGFDVVYGRRAKRDGEPALRRFFTSSFYALANALTTIRLEPQVGDFYLLDRRVVAEVRRCRGQRPFLRGIVQWLGFSRCAVDYERLPRVAGRSKYTWAKLFGLARDCFVSFGINPFPAVLAIAVLWLAASLLALATSYASDQFLAAVIGVLLAGQTVTLLSLVLIGQFAWSNCDRANGRPAYVIDHLDPEYVLTSPFGRAEGGVVASQLEMMAGSRSDE